MKYDEAAEVAIEGDVSYLFILTVLLLNSSMMLAIKIGEH